MKILSMNFVNEADLPKRTRDTEGAKLAIEIGEQIKKIPAGKAISVKLSGVKKWHRYGIQKRLQRSGHKVKVTQINADTFAIFRVS